MNGKQEGCRTVGIQGRMDAEQERCRTGEAHEKEMQDRMDAEQEGCRTGGTHEKEMQDRMDAEQ